MPRERNAYEILGLPRGATTTEIRVRYRQLVRRYQPARATEQLFEDDRFLALVRAFLLLDSPRRHEYDRQVRAARAGPVPIPDLLSGMSPTDRVLLAAEAAFMRSETQEAANLTRTLLDSSQRDARGWALMGEILTKQHRYDEAISSLNYAIQFDPNNRNYWNLLNEATALRDGRAVPKPKAEQPLEAERPGYLWPVLAGTAVVVLLGVWWVAPRIQITWHVYALGIPVGPVIVGGASGLLLGAVLALVKVLDRFDDEMVRYQVWYEVAGGRSQTLVPLGLLLIPVGVICFWLGLAFYAVIAYLNERLSASTSLALVLTAAVTALLTVMTPDARWPAAILGGNATFAGMMLGWFVGSLHHAVWRKVD